MGITATAEATESDGNITLELDSDDPALEDIADNKELVLAIAQLAGQAVSQAIEARARVFLDFGEYEDEEDEGTPEPARPEPTARPAVERRPERDVRPERDARPERGDRPQRDARPERGPRPERPALEEGREAFLVDMSKEIAQAVSQTGRRAVIEGLGSPERRLVHTALMDHGGVKTHSEGGEQNRFLLVEPLQ